MKGKASLEIFIKFFSKLALRDLEGFCKTDPNHFLYESLRNLNSLQTTTILWHLKPKIELYIMKYRLNETKTCREQYHSSKTVFLSEACMAVVGS